MACTKIALLLCDTPNPLVLLGHGDYTTIFTRHLRSSLPSPVDFTVDSYDVVHKMEYPPEDIVDTYDGIMITGSGSCSF